MGQPRSPGAGYPYRWGDPEHPPGLSPAAGRALRAALGADAPDVAEPGPAALAGGRFAVPDPALSAAARRRFEAVVGAAHVLTDPDARLRHAVGQRYSDLLALRAGAPTEVPDAVVMPASHAEVRGVLEVATVERVAVVPFGGGTSVVGGVAPHRGGFAAVASLDLSRMDRVLDVDATSLTATLQPGLTGVRAEALLNGRGLTLGHFPQSFERASIGGFVATRSAGQASTGYGRIDDLVDGLRVATPAGDLELGRAPASAAGPDLRALLVGSEGTLGVITEVRLRVRPAPAARRYEGWSLPSFAAGRRALRALAQAGLAPDVARLSDEAETRFTLLQAGGASGAALRAYLRARGRRRGCLLVTGWEGPSLAVRWRRRQASRILRWGGGLALGSPVGEAWRATRFAGPHLRDVLLDAGLLVETLETAAHWSALDRVHRAVRRALATAFTERAVVLCHVSHLYPTGASLYYTVLARPDPGDAAAQWEAAKWQATEAIVAAGGTITHHHGVGTAHRPWLGAEVGELGVAALRALKARLDPAGIMNPGKLLPDP